MSTQPVSAVIHDAARALRNLGERTVTGCVRKATRSSTGNGFVTLTDDSGASLRVHIHATSALALPSVGDEITVRGLLRVYIANSDVQIDAISIEKGGEHDDAA